MSLINEIKDLYEDELGWVDVEIVNEKPAFVNEKRKQIVSFDINEGKEKHKILEDYEYVIQYNPYEDYFHGKIARKFKKEEKWILINYDCC